ncbi:DUF1351 domain-containing protein [Listeria booriae]|nr:DUF1351 domain-containing protein [Listeria booriae]
MHMLPKITIPEPIIEIGRIHFPAFEKLKEDADKLADHIKNIEVTEDNIKTSKKLLAAVNKEVKELETKRIGIKKDMMIPYVAFEAQVKEIVSIVKVADEHVRQQVKQLEEDEREEKKSLIKVLFEKRIKQYDFKNLFTFDDFLDNSYLNKSMSMNKVETELVEWLTRIEADMTVIDTLAYRTEILAEYVEKQHLALAIQVVTQRYEKKRAVEQVIKGTGERPEPLQQYIYTISNKKDAKMIEMFMEQNQIKYEKVAK